MVTHGDCISRQGESCLCSSFPIMVGQLLSFLQVELKVTGDYEDGILAMFFLLALCKGCADCPKAFDVTDVDRIGSVLR